MAVLSHDIIAITGDFGPSRKYKDLSRWISRNGGSLSNNINAKVTHLIASKDHWKKKTGLVPEALEHPHIKIVNLDWLETSLIYKQHREADFLWTHVERQQRQRKGEKKRYVKEVLKVEENAEEVPTCSTQQEHPAPSVKSKSKPPFAKRTLVKKPTKKMNLPTEQNFRTGQEAAERDLFSDAHHIYRDTTTFAYAIRLSRPNLSTNTHEGLTLTLYEASIAPPHLYATVLAYRGTGPNQLYADGCTGSPANGKTYVLAPVGSDFERAFRAFRAAFHVFVGVDWCLRAWAALPSGLSAQAARAQRKFVAEHGLVGPEEEKDDGAIVARGVDVRRKFYYYKLPDRAMGEATGEGWATRSCVERFGRPPVMGELERQKGGFLCGGHPVVAGSGMLEKEYP